MLALARGLATDPAVLLLDELSMGLAPLVVGRLYEQVAEIARQGVAVLVVEQFAAAVLGIADHAAVLVRGRVGKAGPPRRRPARRTVRPLPREFHMTIHRDARGSLRPRTGRTEDPRPGRRGAAGCGCGSGPC